MFWSVVKLLNGVEFCFFVAGYFIGVTGYKLWTNEIKIKVYYKLFIF